MLSRRAAIRARALSPSGPVPISMASMAESAGLMPRDLTIRLANCAGFATASLSFRPAVVQALHAFGVAETHVTGIVELASPVVLVPAKASGPPT